MTSWLWQRWLAGRHDSGAAPIELVAGIALLLLPAVLLAGSLPAWSARHAAASVAAQEAARAVVRHGCDAGPHLAGQLVAQTAANHEIGQDLALQSLTGCDEGVLSRTGSVTAEVRVRMPALPAARAPRWDLTIRHVEPLDGYRSIP